MGGESSNWGVILDVSAESLGEADVAVEGFRGIRFGLEGDEEVEVGGLLPLGLVDQEFVPFENDSGRGGGLEGSSEGDIETLGKTGERSEGWDGESSAVN